MTIMACQAGKDVYVEKPCSHNVHEGRIAVEMARKNGCIVQHGTQSRSSGSWANLAEIAKSGKLGKLLVSRGLCYKPGGGGSTRGNIGYKQTGTPPSELDFNLWLGPAKEQPYHENLVHYRWHWFWDFGNGDIGNQGVHQMDIARWLIPGATLPKSVFCVGGRFDGPDQGETANTQVAVFDYGQTQLIFEVRGLKSENYHGEDVGNILHFEEGIVAGGKFYPKGKDKPESLPKVETEVTRGPGGGHFGNFIAAMRSRKQADLNADILQGHYSSALCHLANISYRLGEQVSFDGKRLGTDDSATVDAFDRMVDHLRAAGQKIDGQTYSLGRKLAFDPHTEKFSDSQANALLTRNYRKPFVVPEKVA
jgi:predicted dehydrogenase